MIKRCTLILILLASALIPVAAQDDETEVTLPDNVMHQVVDRIVRFYFKPRAKPTTIYFSDRNLKKHWFPKIRNIKFELVDGQADLNGLYGYTFETAERNGRVYDIGFGYGEIGCSGGGSGRTWTFRITGRRVRLWFNGGRWGWNCDADGAGK